MGSLFSEDSSLILGTLRNFWQETKDS
uniref:Uncharacterized protein n=1 Tax=Nelumbo nucifera TaxID=4432 RepID=A0A822ZHX0_NELNU|nr:TPA_asm: hypothetical protein HUJ06_001285 [Nelumbo nucifera]